MSLLIRRLLNVIAKRNGNHFENSVPLNQSRRCISISYIYNAEQKTGKSKELVIVEKMNKLRLIGINRPEKRNCINKATSIALLNAFKEFDADDDSYVAVLYGKGGNFCAGYDLSELSDISEPRSFFCEEDGPMGPTRYETKKPVFAAIEGYAVGGGFELALWCDFRVMEDTAVMGALQRRFGVPMIDGGPSRLPMITGLGIALEFLMTGRPLKVEEALQYNIINIKCATGTAIGQACKHAMSLVNYPQEALRADRTSARECFATASLPQALINEHRRGLAAMEEAKEGAKLFTEGKGKHGVIFNHIPDDFDDY